MRKILLGILLGAAAAMYAAQDTQTVEGLPRHEIEAIPAAGEEPRNIIFMIGDGMGQEHVWAAWLCNGGKLNITSLPYTGFSCTVSANKTVTDSAAGGTALACGGKTNNGMLGQAANGRSYVSLAETLRCKGKATGLVVTKAITDATPAAFYAHTDSRKNTAVIAESLTKAGFDVVLGGGAAAFSEEQMAKLRANGADVELFAPEDCPPASKRGDLLPRSVERALGKLETAPQGFFLMVEGSSIDSAAHDNDLRETVCEVLDFDRAVGVVLAWMRKHPDTLLVVAADHQTGGLSLVDGDLEKGRVKGSFATYYHSGVSVPVYAAGVGAGKFTGVMDNTQLQHKILEVASQKHKK